MLGNANRQEPRDRDRHTLPNSERALAAQAVASNPLANSRVEAMEALSPPRRPRPTTPDSRGRDRKESKFAGEAITNVLAQHQQQEAARRDDERRQKLKQREHARAAARNPYDKLLENQQAEWMRKKDRRSAVISLLRSVGEQLRKTKNPPLSRDAEALGETWAAQPKFAGATRSDYNGEARLSWRGVDLARTLFDAFDADGDGRWTYSDFKRYLEAVGRPCEFEPVVLDSAEAFRCYCDDLFGTDERGLLAFEHFLAYREHVEHTAPVEADVLACGLSAAPAALDEWARVRDAWDALEGHHEDADRPPHTLPASCFRELCYDCRLTLTEEECDLCWRVHVRKNGLMVELREEYKHKHRFGFHQPSSVTSDAAFVYKDAFVAWWFAGRAHEKRAYFREKATGSLLGLRSFLRGAFTMGRRGYERVKRAVDRGLLDKVKLAMVKERLATLDFSFEVGDEGKDLQDEEGKIGIEIDVEHGDDATSTKAKLQVPSQCAASISIDLPAREDADPDEVRRLRKDLKLFLDKYVVPHVQELTPGFQQLRVVKVLPYVPPEDDAAASKKKFNKPEPVDEDEEDEPETIRVQFLWKSEANVDYFLRRRVGLGLGMASLLPEFACSLRCATPLEDLLENTRVVVGAPDFSLRLAVHAIYARSVLHRIGEEVLHARDEDAALKKADRDGRQLAHARALRRSVESHGALLKEGERPIAGITGYEAPAVNVSKAREAFDTAEAKVTRGLLWGFVRWCRCRVLLIFHAIDATMISYAQARQHEGAEARLVI